MNEHDWFNLQLHYPTNSLEDFEQAGATKDNITLKDKEHYKQFKQVQQIFTDQTGKFNDDKYNNWYDNVNNRFNSFIKDQYTKDFTSSNVNYTSSTDPVYNRLLNGKYAIKMPEVSRKIDVFGRTTGMIGINKVSDAINSEREFIQQRNLYDEFGNKLDKTPEDLGFFGATFNSMRQAIYDKDVYDENGKLIHQRGEKKLDADGLPYAELIGDRSNSGFEKYQINPFDVLVKEKSAYNQYAVWEDDDLQKSAMGAFTKNAIKLSAMVAAASYPPTAIAMGLAGVGMVLSDTVPEYIKTYSEVAGVDPNSFKTLNRIQSWATQFNTPGSDYAQENMWSVENFTNMVPMIYGQLSQIKSLAGATYGLSQLATNPTNAGKIADYTTRAYFATMGASELSKTANELGLTPEAKALMLTAGTAGLAGLYSLDFAKWAASNPNVPVFLKSMLENKNVIGNVIKKEADLWKQTLGKNITEVTEEEAKGLGKQISKKLTEIFNYRPNLKQTEFAEYLKAGGAEGLEEVSEQAVLDSVKQMYNWLKKDTDKAIPQGDLWNLSNYGFSFVGGMAGGAIFRATGMGKESEKDLSKSVLDLIEDGKSVEEINKEIDNIVPQYLSTKLSTELNDKGDYLPADGRKSQADEVKDYMKRIVQDTYDAYKDTGSIAELAKKYEVDIKEPVLNMQLDTSLRDDISDSITKIVDLKQQLKQLGDSKEDAATVDSKSKQIIEDLRKEQERLTTIKGRNNTDYYFQQGLYNINAELQDPFLAQDVTKDKIARRKFLEGNEAKGYSDLTLEQKKEVDEEFKVMKTKNDDVKKSINESKQSIDKFIENNKQAIKDLDSKYQNQELFDAKFPDDISFLNSIVDKQGLTVNEKNRLSKVDVESYTKDYKNIISQMNGVNDNNSILEDFEGSFELNYKYLNNEEEVNAFKKTLNDFGIGLDENGQILLESYDNVYDAIQDKKGHDALNTFKPEFIAKYNENLATINPNYGLISKLINTDLNKPLSHPITENQDFLTETLTLGKDYRTDADFENFEDFDDLVKEYKKVKSAITYTSIINQRTRDLIEKLAKTNSEYKDRPELLVMDEGAAKIVLDHINSQIDKLSKYRDKAYENSTKKMRLIRLQWLNDIAIKANFLKRIDVDLYKDFDELDAIITDVTALNGKPISNLNLKKYFKKEVKEDAEIIQAEAETVNNFYKQLVKLEEKFHTKYGDKTKFKELLDKLKATVPSDTNIAIKNNVYYSEEQVKDYNYFVKEKVIDGGTAKERGKDKYIDKNGNQVELTKDVSIDDINEIISRDGFDYLLYLHIANPTNVNKAVYESNQSAPLQHQYQSLLYANALITGNTEIFNSIKPEKIVDANLETFLPRTLVIEGTVGTGKTFILKEINNMFKDNANIVYYAPNYTQRDNLKSNIGDIKLIDKDIDAITNAELLGLFSDALPKDKNNIVVIDEVQSFKNSFIKDLITNNPETKFIFTGDLQQLGSVSSEDGTRSHIAEKTMFFKTSKFDFIVRNSFENLPDTVNNIRTALNPLMNKVGTTYVHNITAKYFNGESNGVNQFNGVYQAGSKEDKSVYENIANDLKSNPTSKLALIGETNEKTAAFEQMFVGLGVSKDQITTKKSNLIKGLEVDYAVIVESVNDVVGKTDNDKRELEFFLTNVGRGKKGVVLAGETFNVKFNNEKTPKLIKRISLEKGTVSYENYDAFVKVATALDGVEAKKVTFQAPEDLETLDEDLTVNDESVVTGDVFLNIKDIVNTIFPPNENYTAEQTQIFFDIFVKAVIENDKNTLYNLVAKLKKNNINPEYAERVEKRIDELLKDKWYIVKESLTQANYEQYFKTGTFNNDAPNVYLIKKGNFTIAALSKTTLQNKGLMNLIESKLTNNQVELKSNPFTKAVKNKHSLNKTYKKSLKQFKEDYGDVYDISDILISAYKPKEGDDIDLPQTGRPFVIFKQKGDVNLSNEELIAGYTNSPEKYSILYLDTPTLALTHPKATALNLENSISVLSNFESLKFTTENSNRQTNAKTLNKIVDLPNVTKYMWLLSNATESDIAAVHKNNLNGVVSLDEFKNIINELKSIYIKAKDIPVFTNKTKEIRSSLKPDSTTEDKNKVNKETYDIAKQFYKPIDEAIKNPTEFDVLKRSGDVVIKFNKIGLTAFKPDVFQLSDVLGDVKSRLRNDSTADKNLINANYFKVLDAVELLVRKTAKDKNTAPIYLQPKTLGSDKGSNNLFYKTPIIYEEMLTVSGKPELPTYVLTTDLFKEVLGEKVEPIVKEETPKQEAKKEPEKKSNTNKTPENSLMIDGQLEQFSEDFYNQIKDKGITTKSGLIEYITENVNKINKICP